MGIEAAANSLFDQYKVKKPETTSSPSPALDLDLEMEPNTDTPQDQVQPAPPKPKAAPAPPKPKVAPAPPKPRVAPAPPKPRVAPAPPKPKAAPVPQQPKAVSAPQAPKNGNHLFDELEETLLTIDWEVNQDNIQKGRDVLNKLVAAHGWTPASPVGRVTAQMDKVLASMFESPESSPTSAPSQLKNAFLAIREAAPGSKSPKAGADTLLTTALSNLQSLLDPEISSASFPSLNLSDDLQAATPVESIPEPVEEPSFDLGLEMSFDTDEEQASPGGIVAEATVNVLKAYNSAIIKTINLITPMESLFASRPAMAKLHTASKKLIAKLASQQKLLSSNFSADYSSYNGLGTLNSWLGSQLEGLRVCVSRISKMENLFAKTTGYEKLFTRSKKIRQILEKQADAITVAVGGTPSQHQFDLTGEYPAIIQPTVQQDAEAPAAAVSAVASPESIVDKCISLAKSIEHNTTDNPQTTGLQIHNTLVKLKMSLSGSAIHSPSAAAAAANAAGSAAAHDTKCRWDWLLKTSWGGQLVGIAPEQVAFESKSTFSAHSFKNQTFFSLKKLKSMPWTKLQGLFTGELAELDNLSLNKMELEIARPPASFPGSSKKKVYLVILYSEGKGKIYLIDSPTEAISVAEEALWVPGSSAQTDIAGTLTVYGSTMPIISID